FAPNSGYIARYAPFIWRKSPTNRDAYLTESIFQTRSSGFFDYQLYTEDLSQFSPALRYKVRGKV
ncbi:MAG: hypothetical protein K2P89_10540, partial [Lachnospiraceae bacterium]|nr:hypothetical protein [Lachnospiraceae bacterium]